MTQISDDSSIDSLLFSCDSESRGGIWDNNNNNDVSLAPEGGNQNVIPPKYEGIRAPAVGLWLVVEMREVIKPQTMYLPDPNPAPEGARH
jgi:hypothetical protein